MNIMFDQTFNVEKQELPVSLTYANIIFVFEDVDAATPIVHDRRVKERWARQRRMRRIAARAQAAGTPTKVMNEERNI